MKYIKQIAYHKNIRNEIPNQELAKTLADENNADGIKEICEYLKDKNKSVSSDCIKVIYEIGYINPDLIKSYCELFLELLHSKTNRMVWGAMIALSTIAHLKADTLWNRLDFIIDTIRKGTLITEVAGIKVLVKIAGQKKEYKNIILPTLMEYMEKCRPIDFAARIETILSVIKEEPEKSNFLNIIEIKKKDLKDSQIKRVNKILKNWS